MPPISSCLVQSFRGSLGKCLRRRAARSFAAPAGKKNSGRFNSLREMELSPGAAHPIAGQVDALVEFLTGARADFVPIH